MAKRIGSPIPLHYRGQRQVYCIVRIIASRYLHSDLVGVGCSGLSFVEGLGEKPDPVYGVHWYGISKLEPQGDRGWGLDDADYAITGNTINLDSYLEATQEYIDYCTANSINTKVYFTTGPVDAIYGEAGYCAYLKYERIRDYVEVMHKDII